MSEPRRGYGAACFAGVTALPPDTDVAVFIDADGSQRPEEIPQVVAPILSGHADLALGARVLLDRHHPLPAAAGTRLVARFVAGAGGSRSPTSAHCAPFARTCCGVSACATARRAGPWRWSSRPRCWGRGSSRCRSLICRGSPDARRSPEHSAARFAPGTASSQPCCARHATFRRKRARHSAVPAVGARYGGDSSARPARCRGGRSSAAAARRPDRGPARTCRGWTGRSRAAGIARVRQHRRERTARAATP